MGTTTDTFERPTPQEEAPTRGTARIEAKNRYKPKQAKLSLEVLEGREVPATLTWLGAVSDDWQNVNNWLTPTGQAPTAVDDVVYDGNYSQAHSTYAGPPGPIAKSITMTASCGGTVKIYSAIDLQKFEQHGGNFEQWSPDADIWTDEWTWTGGNLNATSPFLADIEVKAGGRGTVTGGDKVQGSTMKVGAGARVTINLGQSTNYILFRKNAGIDIAAGAVFEHNRGDFLREEGTSGEINNAGKYFKLTLHDVHSSLPFTNTAATSELHLGGQMDFFNAGTSGVAFLQQAGLIELAEGSVLGVVGLTMNGGRLLTVGTTGSRIDGNVIVHGGTIVLSHNDLTKTGLLRVFGNFLMDGGEYQAKIDGSDLSADRIQARTFAMGGNAATLRAVSINYGSVLPPNEEWVILEVFAGWDGTVAGDFDTKYLSRDDGSDTDFTTAKLANNKKYLVRT